MAIINTLTRKFVLLSIVALILIAVYMYAAILFLHHIKGEGAAINLAGHLRFRSFKMAWLVQKITLEGKPENAELLKKGLKDEAAGFEKIIENLKKGSRELQISPLTKYGEGAVLIFDNIVNDWNLIFKPALLDIITLSSPKKEIQEYDNLINAYVEKINAFVKHMETDYEEKVRGFTFFTFSAVFVFSVTAAVIIIYIRRSIVSPLKTLNDAVNNIENKKFNICVDIKSRDELEHLGNAFNSMAQRLGALCAEKAMLIQSLEDKVMERTKGLEAALIQADAANRAKTDFLANMSHELRTPLNSVIGFSELLLESEPDSALTDKQKKFLNYINESGKQLLALIDDVLDLSKIEAGEMKLSTNEFNLEQMAAACLSLFRENALKRNIKVDYSIDVKEDIVADEQKIRQVLLNLLSNAFKFTPDGGSVYVRARKIQNKYFQLPLQGGAGAVPNPPPSPFNKGGQEGDYQIAVRPSGALNDTKEGVDFIEISVEDTGIGILEDDQKRLFKSFQQLESAYTKKYPGTGLGLSLCKKLVELHNGKIWVESEKGKGSRFKFVIPV